ncbi:MAG: enoyl-CoA hydratase/isomerase family protein [Deltaproteobacteria bacterium]|nr:enoyl-CoA hydratase/isomerase family protein [Deltaproteobacteria bacterium]
MAIIEWEKDETVAIMTLNNGENRHNPEFIKAILNAFDEIEQVEATTALIIASSSEKYWSLGIDLEWITGAFNNQDFESIKEFMYGLNKMFTRALLFPLPVIAAINGHTFGDGSMLACACDFRFMKTGRGYFCFPEVDISIPFVPSMLETIRKSIPHYYMEELILTGKKAGAQELEEHRVVLKACENDEELMRESLVYARTFNKKRSIFAEHKKRMHRFIFEVMESEDPKYIDSLNLMA